MHTRRFLWLILLLGLPAAAQNQASLGLNAFEQGNYQQAATYFQQAITHQPSFSHYINLGHCFLRLEQWQPAVQAYQNALAIESSLATATIWRCLGQACFQADKYNQAIEAFQQARTLESNSSDVLWLAQAYMAVQRWASAEVILLSQLDRQPGHKDCLRLLADIYIHQQLWHRAGSLFRELMVLDPTNASFRLGYAQIQAQAGDYQRAHDTLEIALHLDPTCHTQIGRLLADLQLTQDLPREAALCYARLSHRLKHPKGEDLYRLGTAYLRNEEFTSAAKVFTRLRGIDPNDVRALQCLGQIQSLQSNKAAARDYYQEALHLDPQSPSLHLALAELALHEKDYVQALGYFHQAIALGEASLGVFIQAISAARQVLQDERAITLLKQGLFHFPKSQELLAQLDLLTATE